MASQLDTLLEEVRVLAMAAVESPDGEYFIRRICRWYSQTFSTPLHFVESEIPIEDVLIHYFEWKYERMEDEERDIEVDELMLTPDQREAKKKKTEAEDDAFLDMVKGEAAAASRKNPGLARLNLPRSAEERAMELPLIPVMGTNQPLNESALANKPTALGQLPPEIKMEFVEDLGNLDDWDLMGPAEVDPDKRNK